MIKIFKTFGGYVEINKPQKDCCINVTNPTTDEINKLCVDYSISNLFSLYMKGILQLFHQNLNENSFAYHFHILTWQQGEILLNPDTHKPNQSYEYMPYNK